MNVTGASFTASDLAGNSVFWVIAVNIVCFVCMLVMLSSSRVKDKFFELPKIIQKPPVFFISGPPCILAFLAQPEITPQTLAVLVPGIILCFAGCIVVVLAFGKIGVVPSFRQKDQVITTGAYGVVRHPVYTGAILFVLGLALALNALYALIYAPVFALLFWLGTVFEERELIKEYGDEYREYRTKTKSRLVPYII